MLIELNLSNKMVLHKKQEKTFIKKNKKTYTLSNEKLRTKLSNKRDKDRSETTGEEKITWEYEVTW